MAKIEPIIEINELKFNKLDRLYRKESETVYVVYDELMDEFYVKVVPPDDLVSVYYVDENFAFLVIPETAEVVGIMLSDFEQKVLPQKEDLWEYWKNEKCAILFSEYQKISRKQKHEKKLKVTLKRTSDRNITEWLTPIEELIHC